MTILRESPWYAEILKEGIEQGIEQGVDRGREEMLLGLLRYRFGDLDEHWIRKVHAIPSVQLEQVLKLALAASSLDDLAERMRQTELPLSTA